MIRLAVVVTALTLARPAALAPQAAPPALAGLPSAPGAHIAQIQSLGDNQWLNLGAPAADPAWGKGRGRSWSNKMPYASELRGAFLGGTGVHAYIKPDGRYSDDTYFYDLNAHRWIAIYPGTDTRTFVDKIGRGELDLRSDGQLVDSGGQPVPYGSIGGHSYQTHTYSSDLRMYLTVWGSSGFGGDQSTVQMTWHQDGARLMQQRRPGIVDRVAGMPFFYNTVTGHFERHAFNRATPCRGQGDNVIYALPGRNVLWLYSGYDQSTSFGDFSARRWSDAGAPGPAPSGIDFGGCYDSTRDRIYLGASGYGPASEQDKIFVYDVAANTWSAPPNGGAQTFVTSNYSCVHYDTVNDRVLDIRHWGSQRGITVFDPAAFAWDASVLPLPAQLPAAGQCWSGFYSPELNAHFFYISGDSDDRGSMWVYRYKRAGTPSSDTQAPSVPANLQASAISSSQIDLAWTASSDNVAVAGYRVFRGGNLVATVGGTSFSDMGLAPSTPASYTVVAFDAAGNASAPSSPATATTLPAGGGVGDEGCGATGLESIVALALVAALRKRRES